VFKDLCSASVWGAYASLTIGVPGALQGNGWMPGLVTGVLLGSVAGVYFANAMREPDEERDRVDEQSEERLPAPGVPDIDTKRWEFYALTVVPLLTVPVLFAVQSLLLTFGVLLVLALSSPFLLRRLRQPPPEP
jgi:hypothetical protein